MTKQKITIIGSGLAGSFLAVLLAQRGYKVEIYERLSKEEIYDIASKRSYNLVLFGYGINLLKEAGLWDILEPHMLPLKGTVTHIASSAKPLVTPVDTKDMHYYTISRAQLTDILLKEATRHQSVSFYDNTSFVAINRHEKTMIVKNNKTKKITTLPYDVLIGADGANSLVRSFIQQNQTTNHRQEYAQWSYKQFVFKPELVTKIGLEKKFVHIWTQKDSFIIAHPDHDDSLAAMFVLPKKLSKTLHSTENITSYFKENFPDLLPAIEEITQVILKNPDGNFATILTEPWYYKDSMAIIGDAAHGFYPFFGQGTSAAFGDCMQLCKLIDEYNSDWGKIFPLYQEKRKKNTDALAELSKESLMKNLRFKKADYDAIYDRLQTVAHALFPNIIYPPFSQTITKDPGRAAEHREHYYRQRKIANKFGVSFIVKRVEETLSFYEKIRKS